MLDRAPLFSHQIPAGGGGGVPIEGGDDGQPRPVIRPDGASRQEEPREERPKIRTFEQRLIQSRHEENWDRTPNVTGTGAIHVRSFHCKFSEEALAHLDQQINEWLDAHPQYEVKFVSTSRGEWRGKLGVEPCMVVQVWV